MPERQITEEELSNMSPEQLSELQKQNCVFCHIISGKIPSKKVYEDEICTAIVDINPASRGHVLLIPKEHFVVLPQVPENTAKHLGKISKMISMAALRSLSAEGTNIFVANGAVAGQRAPHAMIHIIPRMEGDGITCFELPEREISESAVLAMQKLLGSKLGYKVEQQKKSETPKDLEEIDLNQLKKMIE